MNHITIRPLEQGDHDDWQRLWRAYLKFYETELPQEIYAATWQRLLSPGEYEPKGFIALADGRAVGLTHYMYHRSGWSLANKCYLQDLFVDPAMRGGGVGAALIEAVREAAEEAQAGEVYWLTHESNAKARRLYDHVAKNTGFLKYRL